MLTKKPILAPHILYLLDTESITIAFSYKPSISNEESDNINEINKETIKWKAEEINIPINGVKKKFALNKATMEVYDYDSVKQAREFGSDPILIGRLIDKGDGKMKFVQV